MCSHISDTALQGMRCHFQPYKGSSMAYLLARQHSVNQHRHNHAPHDPCRQLNKHQWHPWRPGLTSVVQCGLRRAAGCWEQRRSYSCTVPSFRPASSTGSPPATARCSTADPAGVSSQLPLPPPTAICRAARTHEPQSERTLDIAASTGSILPTAAASVWIACKTNRSCHELTPLE